MKAEAEMLTGAASPQNRPSWRDDLRVVLPSWIIARVLVLGSWVLAAAIAGRWLPSAVGAPEVAGLISWDGGFYRDIAVIGYEGLANEVLRFFPLYPLAGRLLAPLAGGSAEVALVVIANAASLVAGVAVRRLVLIERGDDALATRAVWALNLFPAAFVLVWGYAEAMFVALAVGTFVAARRGRFAVAGGLALAAALTRPIGVLLAVPLAIEAARGLAGAGPRDRLARAGATLAPMAGLALYLGWVGRTFGDPWLPFTVQDGLRNTTDPVRGIIHSLSTVFTPERADALHVPFALAFIALAIVVGMRWPASHTAFAACLLVVALGADNLNSIERYALNAFPLLLAIADLTATRARQRLAVAAGGAGLVGLCTLAWLARYVP